MATGIGIGTSQSLRRILVSSTNGPINTTAPQIDADGTGVGNQMTVASNGDWTNVQGSLTFIYQWYRDNAPITGETADTYTIQIADSNKTIKCLVYATDNVGTGNAFSNSIPVGFLWGATTIGQIWGSLTNLIWGS